MASPKSHSKALQLAGVRAHQFTGVYVDPEALILITDRRSPLYDPRVESEIPESFLDDIRAYGGVHTAIKVRKDGIGPDGVPRYVVIAGKHRVRAARQLNQEAGEVKYLVPATIVTGSDEEMFDLMISENLHHNVETTATLAFKVQRRQRQWGGDAVHIAKKLSMSPQRIEALLAYNSLHADVQRAVDTGTVGVGTILAFATLPQAEQPKALALAAAAGATKNHEVKAAVKAAARGERELTVGNRKKMFARGRLTKLVERLEGAGDTAPTDAATLRVVVATLKAVLGDAKQLAALDTELGQLFTEPRTKAARKEAHASPKPVAPARERPRWSKKEP